MVLPEIAVKKPPKWVLPVAVVPIIAVVVAGYIAGATWATLLKSHPLALIALSPINRHLLLTTNHLGALEYFAVGLGRHLLPDPFFYLLGYWYGDKALAWAAEVYPAVHRLVGKDGRGMEDPAHRRILYPLAFVMPNNWVSLVSGSARIPIAAFVTLNITGTAARLVLCRWLGSVFSSEVNAIANFVTRYQWPVTIASFVLVMIGIATQVRKGTGELVGLTHLADELDEE